MSNGVGLPLGASHVFGALTAAADPVSVVALFRIMGAPNRLEILLEDESLFNDGTAIVISIPSQPPYSAADSSLVRGSWTSRA